MHDNILLFSSKWDIIRTIGMIDPSKEKLQNPDLYYLWLYGKDLIPGSKDFTYYVNTHQEYLLRSLNDKPFFKDLMSKFPGLRDLYLDAMRRLE